MDSLRTLTMGSALVGLVLIAGAVEAAAEHWLTGTWSHRAKLTVDPSQIEGAFTDFPLLIALDDPRLQGVFEESLPDGSDLVVTAADATTILDHELVSYDPMTRTGELWFRAPALSISESEFYVYFGAAEAMLAGSPQSTWSGDYLAVYHFADDPTSRILYDSSPRTNDALAGLESSWTEQDRVPARIGSGWFFDDSDDWLYCASMTSAASSFTVSAWFANADLNGGGQTAFQSLAGYWNLSFQRTDGQPFAALRTEHGVLAWNPFLTDNEIHHYLWTLDAEADTVRFYFDGVEQSVRLSFREESSVPIYSGESIDGRAGIAGPAFFNNLDLVHGTVDEFRVREGVLSPAWISAEFANQSDPIGFYDVVIEIKSDHPTATDVLTTLSYPRITVYPNPMRNVADITVEGGLRGARIAVFDVAGRLVRVLTPREQYESSTLVRWDGRDSRGLPAGGGTYFVRAIGARNSAATKILLLE
jgi:hypothetical protein